MNSYISNIEKDINSADRPESTNKNLIQRIESIEKQYAETITKVIKECEQRTGRPFHESPHADKAFGYLEE